MHRESDVQDEQTEVCPPPQAPGVNVLASEPFSSLLPKTGSWEYIVEHVSNKTKPTTKQVILKKRLEEKKNSRCNWAIKPGFLPQVNTY